MEKTTRVTQLLTQQNANTTKKMYKKAIPVALTAGLPSCWAVQAVIMDKDIVINMLPDMSIVRRPKRSIRQRPLNEAIIIIGVCSAFRRSWVLVLVIPTVLTNFGSYMLVAYLTKTQREIYSKTKRIQ